MTLRLIATIIGHDETVKVYRDVDWNEYRVRIVGADATKPIIRTTKRTQWKRRDIWLDNAKRRNGS